MTGAKPKLGKSEGIRRRKIMPDKNRQKSVEYIWGLIVLFAAFGIRHFFTPLPKAGNIIVHIAFGIRGHGVALVGRVPSMSLGDDISMGLYFCTIFFNTGGTVTEQVVERKSE